MAKIPYLIEYEKEAACPRGMLLNRRILDLRLQGKDEEELSLVDRIEGGLLISYNPYVDESSIQASVEALSAKSEEALKPIEDSESSS